MREGDDDPVVHAICVVREHGQEFGGQDVDVAIWDRCPCFAMISDSLADDFSGGVIGIVGMLEGMAIEPDELSEQATATLGHRGDRSHDRFADAIGGRQQHVAFAVVAEAAV